MEIPKTIIALQGKANQGKTTTIRRLADLIREEFSNAQYNPEKLPTKGDIWVIITIGKIKIGIESQGDPGSRIITHNTLDGLAINECDIIICASRTSGETVRVVERVAKEYKYRLFWRGTYANRFKMDPDKLNEKAAEHTLDLVKAVMAGVL